jgi:phage terminase large subunit
VAWVEEAQTLSDRSLEMLRPTIRKRQVRRLLFQLEPAQRCDPVDLLLRGVTPPPDAVVQRVNYSDNPFFPAELDAERLHDKATKPVRYGHIWLGEYEPVAIGAIWDRLMLHRNRRSEAPDLGADRRGGGPGGFVRCRAATMHGIIVCGDRR